MVTIKVNDKHLFEIEQDHKGTIVNGKAVSLDIVQAEQGVLSILYNNRSYSAELVDLNKADKTAAVKINGNLYTLTIKDQFDELLHRLGMDKPGSAKISELKAPMPGLVLKVLAAIGDKVKKGQNLLVLEAMKMENIIKSPADLKIKSLQLKPGDKVEKNQVLITFE